MNASEFVEDFENRLDDAFLDIPVDAALIAKELTRIVRKIHARYKTNTVSEFYAWPQKEIKFYD